MVFFKIINKKKFTLISILLFLYIMLNLIDGKRGLISYFEKKNVITNLEKKESTLQKKLNLIEKKNSMLTEVIDLDFLETIYRIKFMVGKKEEKVFVE
jgi:hypothetical protein